MRGFFMRACLNAFRFAESIFFQRHVLRWQKYFVSDIKKTLDCLTRNGKEACALDTNEESCIAARWSWLRNPDLSFYSLVKTLCVKGNLAEYVSDELYFSYILPFLNPINESRVLEDKSKYAILFSGLSRPKELVRRIRGGVYLNEDNEPMTLDVAVQTVRSYAQPIIVKPTIDSQQGNGVILVNTYCDGDVRSALTSSDDVTIQGVVDQSSEMARLNSTSLNSFRITTLLLNGRFSVLSSIVRVGACGSHVDNVGAGGYAVGVSDEGFLLSPGLNAKGECVNMTYEGCRLDSIRLSRYKEVCEFARRLHYRIPYVSLVGWDIAVKRDGTPILIELNASTPGIRFEQLCTGPIFGDRFDEVVRFVKMRMSSMRNNDFLDWRPDSRFNDISRFLRKQSNSIIEKA